MKKGAVIAALVAGCLLLQLCGCQQKPESSVSETETSGTVETELSVQTSEEEVPTSSLVKSVKRIYSGEFSSWREYEYDDNEYLIKTIHYDAGHNVTGVSERQNDANGNPVMVTGYDADHNPVHVTVYHYDDENNKENSTTFNMAGIAVSRREYYPDGTLKMHAEYHGNGSVRTINTFNEKGSLVGYEAYSDSGEKVEWLDASYDDNGNMLDYIVYDGNGDVMWSINQRFDENGNLIFDSNKMFRRQRHAPAGGLDMAS